MESKTKYVIAFFIGLVLGFAVGTQGILERDQTEVFERGRAQGLAECQEPSRLEKAAKWISE